MSVLNLVLRSVVVVTDEEWVDLICVQGGLIRPTPCWESQRLMRLPVFPTHDTWLIARPAPTHAGRTPSHDLRGAHPPGRRTVEPALGSPGRRGQGRSPSWPSVGTRQGDLFFCRPKGVCISVRRARPSRAETAQQGRLQNAFSIPARAQLLCVSNASSLITCIYICYHPLSALCF